MTEQQPGTLSVESAHLSFDPSDQMTAALGKFYNEKYHARRLTPALHSVASFQFYRIDGGRIAPFPPAEPDIVERSTPLGLRMSTYSSSRLRPLQGHQMPLGSALRIQHNKRGNVRLFFRIIPTHEDRIALASLHDLSIPEHDSSIEVYTHIHPQQRVIGKAALEAAYINMASLLEIGQAQRRGVSDYHAERTPLDRSKRLFVTGARLAQTAMLYRVPVSPEAEAS